MKTKLFLFLTLLCGVVNAQLPDSLIACYNFSGNANDGTGNGYNGNVVNATLTTDRFGNANSAYSFNGTTSNITIPTANLNMNQYSYSAWVCLNALPTNGNRFWVLSIGSASGDQFLNYNNNSLYGHGWGSGGYNSTTPHGFIYDNTNASVNQWYHLVVTRSATESKFYVNGVLIDSFSVTSTNTAYYGSGTLTAKIGIRFDNTNPFNGKIDDIKIYERPLTDGEVSSLYTTTTGCSNQSGEITCNGFVSIHENFLTNFDLKLYPNPFSTQITLQTDSRLNNATLVVYNYLGQTVKQIKNISGQTITLFRDNLPSGQYYVQITQDSKIITTNKLVITD